MFSNYSNSALETISTAVDIAADLGHSWVGAEHILLALICSKNVSNVFASSGVIESEVRSDIVNSRGSLSAPLPVSQVSKLLQKVIPAVPNHSLPFTPTAKEVFDICNSGTLKPQSNHIDDRHIFLAILRLEKGLASEILRRNVLDLEELRSKLISMDFDE